MTLASDAARTLEDGDAPSEKTKAKVAYLPDKMTYPHIYDCWRP